MFVGNRAQGESGFFSGNLDECRKETRAVMRWIVDMYGKLPYDE
jgi:hypothetical protein